MPAIVVHFKYFSVSIFLDYFSWYFIPWLDDREVLLPQRIVLSKGCCTYKVVVLLLNLIAFWCNNYNNNYLGLLKNSGMIHAKFSWYWLNKTLVPNWNDLETTTQDMKLFYCTGQVIPITLCKDNKWALICDYVKWVNFTTKPHLKAKFFAFVLFVCGYSFLLYCLGRLQNSRFFFLKIIKEIGKACRKSLTRRVSVSPQSRSLFSALFQTFCLTARVYLNMQKYGLFWSLLPW